MTKKLFPLILLALISLPSDVFASCYFSKEYTIEKYEVLETVPVIHHTDQNIEGCLGLIKNGMEELVAYIPFKFVCEAKETKEFDFKIDQSCCDTGYGGDYPCGVKVSDDEVINKEFAKIQGGGFVNLLAYPSDAYYLYYTFRGLFSSLVEGAITEDSIGKLIDPRNALEVLEEQIETPEKKDNFISMLPIYEKILESDQVSNKLYLAKFIKQLQPNTNNKHVHEAFVSIYPLYEQDSREAIEFFEKNSNLIDDEIKEKIQNTQSILDEKAL